ncbi:DUF6263 family protein [Jiangella anatolica]|uniref:Uncharacterized protein n=1 Tax=Jiangella anatolica TaxID=2670374 RepID=A0A2W2C0X7_9ACTN|nr:DUF6263 family protein [Jiangella anatolica]PZF79426.1 hypothetical protein C1I92_31250 [Jiangella anatolica]
MRRIAGRLTVAAALLVLAACGRATEADVAAADDGPAPAASASCTDGPPEATVSDPGAEPRTLMELAPSAGDTGGIDLSLTIHTTATVDGVARPAMAAQPMVIGMAMTVEEVTDDEITTAIAYDRVEADGVDAATRASLETVVGIGGTITTTRSGAFVDGGLDLAGLDPQLAPMMRQLEEELASLTIPLPTVPVGIGATWDVVTDVDAQGITWCTTTGYELTAFDGDAYELAVEASQRLEPGTIEEGGVTIDVVEGSGSSTGTSGGRLSFPVAVEGSSNATNSVVMASDGAGTEQTVEVKTAIQAEITGRG